MTPRTGPVSIGEAPGTPSTPVGSTLDAGSWRVWWSFNQDKYLSLAERIARSRKLSNEHGEAQAELVDAFRQDALAVFQNLLVDGDALEVLREVLKTLGRLADEPSLGDLPPLDFYARHFLAMNAPALKSGALLGLGARGDASAIPLLRALLSDASEGRAALNGRPVDESTRVLAAYVLGLLSSSASHSGALALAADLLDALESELLELRIAAALALGRMELEACSGRDFQLEGRHLCRDVLLDELLARASDAAERPEVRAHATGSFGRLGAGAAEPEGRHRAAGALLWLLDTAGEEAVLQSAVIALGNLAGGLEPKLEDQVRTRLQEQVESGEPAVQRLALMALAEGAGRSASRGMDSRKTAAFLVRELVRGKRVLRPWSALALGVLGHGLLEARQSVDEVVDALRGTLRDARDPELGAATALALGILRQEDPESQEALLRLHRRLDKQGLADALTLSLGLLHAHGASALLRERFEHGDPHATVALLVLGDREVGKNLHAAIQRGVSPEMVRALSLRAEPETVTALSKLLGDRSAPARTRASAAAALGDLLDGDRPHWSAAYAGGLNYFALPRSLAGRTGDAVLDGRPWP
jgi:hypothetical protein